MALGLSGRAVDGSSTARAPAAALGAVRAALGSQGFEPDRWLARTDLADRGEEPPGCAVERWVEATSGWAGCAGSAGRRLPRVPPGDLIGRLEAVGALIAEASGRLGAEVGVDVGRELSRPKMRGRSSPGPERSVGGRCRMVRAADGWVAISLARPSDVEAVPAIVGRRVPALPGRGEVVGDAWGELERYCSGARADRLVERSQLLGVPAARVPRRPAVVGAPWRITGYGSGCPNAEGGRERRGRPPLVVNLAALWAGPLAAHLLWRSGAEVVTVEDAGRPDGARRGDPELFERLHRGHRMVAVDFSSRPGRRELVELVGSADLVVEGSRPRALEALGLDPEAFCSARPGRTWLSITGYGRTGPRANWTAFGDDAAAAAGVVGWDPAGRPGFCGDALADPVAGLCGAAGALVSMAAGGGHLVDTSMVAAAAFAAGGTGCGLDHRFRRSGGAWRVAHLPPGEEPAAWQEGRRGSEGR